MCEVMEELREESIQRGVDKNRIENIKIIMRKLKLSAEQAMDFLEIPSSEQAKYIVLL